MMGFAPDCCRVFDGCRAGEILSGTAMQLPALVAFVGQVDELV
jgi:hypothetical protein